MGLEPDAAVDVVFAFEIGEGWAVVVGFDDGFVGKVDAFKEGEAEWEGVDDDVVIFDDFS